MSGRHGRHDGDRRDSHRGRSRTRTPPPPPPPADPRVERRRDVKEKERARSRSRSREHKRERSVDRRRRASHSRSRSRSPKRRRRRSHSTTESRSRSRSRERQRRRRSHLSSSSSSSSDDSHHRDRRKKRKGKHKKHRDESRSRSRSRERKERKKEKKEKKHKKKKKSGASGAHWGKYGIIGEPDMYNKEPEFRTWLVEERMINSETLSKEQTKKEFARFAEDYNTATLPHEKFYNMEAYERRMSALRGGEYLPPMDDGYDANADLAAHSSSHKRRAVEKESYLSREQLMELRKVQNERVELGKMKALGMDIKQNFGVRMDGSQFEE